MKVKGIDLHGNSRGEIWLNVASSTQVLEDFINLDNHIFLYFLRPLNAFRRIVPGKYRRTIELYHQARRDTYLIRHDCRNPLDHILCSHFLEHVYPVEMAKILEDFYRVMKCSGTLHVIVPDLYRQARQYLAGFENGDPGSADEFVRATMLSRESRGSFKYRCLEFIGGFGLQHGWMYDSLSLAARLRNAGFEILATNETPSKQYRLDDGSVHLVAGKP